MLQESAVIVKLNISQFGFRKKDKKVTEDVNQQYNATKDAGAYNKAILNAEAPEIKAIKEIVSTARSYHVENTLPWHDGARLLPSAAIMEYRDVMEGRYKQQFDDAVEDFLNKYDTLKQNAYYELGSMYNAADYPDKTKVESAFGFKITIEPIAGVDSFWTNLHDDEIKKIKSEYQADIEDKEEAAMSELWARLYESVNKMAESLSDDDKIFRDSLVGNVIKMTEILPKLNIKNDPNLEAMRKEVVEKLFDYTPKELRKDKEARKVTAKTAKEICEAMSGYMGAFPTTQDIEEEVEAV